MLMRMVVCSSLCMSIAYSFNTHAIDSTLSVSILDRQFSVFSMVVCYYPGLFLSFLSFLLLVSVSSERHALI